VDVLRVSFSSRVIGTSIGRTYDDQDDDDDDENEYCRLAALLGLILVPRAVIAMAGTLA